MPGTLRPAAAIVASAALLVVACSEPPLAPPLDIELALPRLEFALIDDTASFRGTLLDSLTIVVPDSVDESGSFDLWPHGEVLDYALIEILSDIELDNRSVSAAELLPSPNPIVYYRSDGELVFRAFHTEFFALPPAGGEVFQSVSSEQSGDSIVVRDTDGADHGMRVYWFMGEEEELGYNAIADSVPPACALLIGEICYPPPGFTTPNISSTPPAGRITLRAFRGAAEPDSFSLTLSADTTRLHPWIPNLTVNGLQQDLRPGDTATFAASAAVSAIPADEVEVSVWAEFVDSSGGHTHATSRVALHGMPSAANGVPQFGALVGKPWGGFFDYDDEQQDSFEAETTDGELEFSFVAGVLGGEIDVIVETVVDTSTYADTVRLEIRVPGLINDTTEIATVVLFVGGTTPHTQGFNHHVTPDVADRMGRIAAAMAQLAGSNRYLQHNDASLPWGGTFTVNPDSGGTGEWPLKGHLAHALGVDIDIAWCYAAVPGFTTNQAGRVQGTNCSGTAYVDLEELVRIANRVDACADAHPSIAGGGDDHYHIHFAGACGP